MRSVHIGISLGLLFLFQAACGGNVVMEPNNQGGSGGQGGQGGEGGGAVEVCKFYCSEKLADGCIEDEAKCLLGCENQHKNVGICSSTLGAAETCAAQNGSPAPNCAEFPPTCVDEAEAHHICVATAPCKESGACTVSAGQCACKNDCSGVLLETECDKSIGGTGLCTCRFNGEVVGTCPADAGCDNLSGCCAGIFAEAH